MILDRSGKPLRKGDLVRATFEDGVQFAIFQEVVFGSLAHLELGSGSTAETGLDLVERVDLVTRVGGTR